MRHFIKLTSNYIIMSNKITQYELDIMHAKAIYFYIVCQIIGLRLSA